MSPSLNQLAVEFSISTPTSNLPSVMKNVRVACATPQRSFDERLTSLVPKEVTAYKVLPVTE